MADIIGYRDIPQNSTSTLQLPKLCYGVLLQNNTNVYVFVNNDRGVPIMNCPPGITLGWNEPDGMYTPSVGCAGYYQGNGRVYFYDGLLDLTNNPTIQQPPGNVNVSGTVTTVPASPLGVRVHCDNSTVPVPLLRDSTNIGVVCDETTIAVGGRLNVYTTVLLPDASLVTRFIVAGVYFLPSTYASQQSMIPFEENIFLPSGATVYVFFEGTADFIISY